MAGPRADKVAVVEEVRDHLERADAAILTEYRGLKVGDLATLRRQGLTIVIVTHDVSLAANYADRIVVQREGSVVLDGAPDEVFRKVAELRSCLVTPPQVATLAQAIDRDPSAFTCRVGEMVEQLSRA